ncbi:hypothetical protein ALO_18095 [Acetonema longum DSM 6540]|uniref:Uncharacterized protein n=2 Tax=Acetonema TaxID=2373 RepID=F7NNC9_9FIRM|nr:hypothetical protein ALO_18095 [Acetonema longum DSM 6540]
MPLPKGPAQSKTENAGADHQTPTNGKRVATKFSLSRWKEVKSKLIREKTCCWQSSSGNANLTEEISMGIAIFTYGWPVKKTGAMQFKNSFAGHA